MKKTRYIPYGYTVKDGITVVERTEADIVQDIFRKYIDGLSLKDIAQELTSRKVPYTERTSEWDKARIARIIDNNKYIGNSDYEPIIDEETYEVAVSTKIARQRNTQSNVCQDIICIRDRIRCAKCNAMMIYRRYESSKVKDTWVCTNRDCGCKVRIPNQVLLEKITLTLNRIIENSNLMIPKIQPPKHDEAPSIKQLEGMLRGELQKETLNENTILTLIQNIASEKYAHYDADDEIAIRLAQQRVRRYRPQEEFQEEVFNGIAETVVLDEQGIITVKTKTNAFITEDRNGS